jgi:hypothetical protein
MTVTMENLLCGIGLSKPKIQNNYSPTSLVICNSFSGEKKLKRKGRFPGQKTSPVIGRGRRNFG